MYAVRLRTMVEHDVPPPALQGQKSKKKGMWSRQRDRLNQPTFPSHSWPLTYGFQVLRMH